MYLSSQLFSETPHKSLKLQEKSERKREKKQREKKGCQKEGVRGSDKECRKCIFQRPGDLDFKNFPFAVPYGVTVWR